MNGIILVDKPEGWTSHDAVAKMRGILGERRIGHSGTLDPMATGLLVVFVGRATRAVEFAESHEKEYIAGLHFGIDTDTQDITGNILGTSEKHITENELSAVLNEFTGEIMQKPPMYSAIKINGKKLCNLARNGVEVARESRPVTIKKLEISGMNGGDFVLSVVCSKGTYVRTLCHDIGERLGSCAVLSSLRRTRAGNFSVENAHTIDEIRDLASANNIGRLLLPVDSLFSEYAELTITEKQRQKCLCGSSFAISAENGSYRVYAEDSEFLMLGTVEDGQMRTLKSFFEI